MRRILLGLLLPLAIIGCTSTPPAGTPRTSPGASAATASPAAVVTPPVSPTEVPTAAATAAPTQAPTASSTTSATTPPCTAGQLKASVTRWEGAAGHQIASVLLQNAAKGACIVQGTPGVQLVDAHDVVLIDSATADEPVVPHVDAGDEAYLLDPGTVIATMVQVANYCGDVEAALPTTVAFLLPSDGGRLVADPGPGGDVPACMSSPGMPGSIDMNGWTR